MFINKRYCIKCDSIFAAFVPVAASSGNLAQTFRNPEFMINFHFVTPKNISSINFVNMDVLSPEQRRRNMQAIRSTATKEEVTLARTLWRLGYRYRKNNRKVFGNPDLTFAKCKIAIFVDGEYFHGYNWETEKYRIKTNRAFWWKKIESNMRRDEEVNQKLVENGWRVLRFWSHEIRKNLANCVGEVEKTLTSLCP